MSSLMTMVLALTVLFGAVSSVSASEVFNREVGTEYTTSYKEKE